MIKIDSHSLFLERLGIVAAFATFLYVFRTVIPSGEALDLLGYVEAGRQIWNPNHLLFEPISYWLTVWGQCVGIDACGLNQLKVVSGVSTLLSLLIFHSILCHLGTSTIVRIFCVVGLFASKNFISMAVSEEFFMIQMPFLMGALWFIVRYFHQDQQQKSFWYANPLATFCIGATLAVSIAITVNNIFLLMFLAFGLLWTRDLPIKTRWLHGFYMGVGAMVVGLPIFAFAYVFSQTDSTFFHWLTVYQGLEDNPEGDLYGVPFTVQGFLISFTRLGFNFFANFIEVGNLGSAFKTLAFGLPLDFKISWLSVAGSLVLMSMIGLIGLALLVWFFRKGHQQSLEKMLMIWVLSYFVFNLFWDDSSDQFWFQILPPLWILGLLAARLTQPNATTKEATEQTASTTGLSTNSQQWTWVVSILGVSLLVLNTSLTVGPKAFFEKDSQSKHIAAIEENSLQFIPGWSEVYWLGVDKHHDKFEQQQLMHLALEATRNEEAMLNLPKTIHEHLASGKKVYMARVFDPDQYPRPWDNLRRLGWPRERIIGLLEDFEATPVQELNGVVVRELTLKNPNIQNANLN